jgi:hypothetical protein
MLATFVELQNQPPFPPLGSMNLVLQAADQGKDLCPSHLQLPDLKTRKEIKKITLCQNPDVPQKGSYNSNDL